MSQQQMPPSRRGATIGFVYHASVQKPDLGPADGEQKLGRWCSPEEGNECAGAPTVSCTVSVALAAGQPDIGADWEDAFLRVRFGSGEIDDQILEVDLMNGTSFPLVARSAIFELVYPKREKAGGVYQPKIDLQVSIGLGVLGASGARGARRTVLCGDIAQQGGATIGPFPIPPFAVDACYASSDATATATLTQEGSANGLPVLAVNTIEKFSYRCVPVRQGARNFSLTTTAPATGNAVIFFLSPA